MAKCFSLNNSFQYLADNWAKNQKKMMQPGNFKTAELHAIISVIKPITSWTAHDGIAICRRACGGLGYSYYSRFSILQSGADINQTWEGDNNVLLQQTTKYLLDCYKAKMKGKDFPTSTCGWVKTDDVLEEKSQAEDIESFLKIDHLKSLFEYRCNKLLQKLAMQIGSKTMDKANDPFEVWNDAQVFGIQELALAYGDYISFLFDANLLKKMENRETKDFRQFKPGTKEAIMLLFRLSTLHKIQKDLASWYENDYLTPDHGEMVRDEIKAILPQFKRFAINLTDCMSPEDEENDSMIAPEDGDLYKSIQQRIYSVPGVFERIGSWKELIAKPKM